MADNPDHPGSSDDKHVLSPDDLDITDEDNVVEIDDGRFVISPSGHEPVVPNDSDGDSGSIGGGDDEETSTPELTDGDVHEWIEDRLDSADAKYAFDVSASFEGDVSQKALFSNDVVTTFENLVTWYAHHAGGDTPVEDVLGILLVESNLPVRFPPDSLRAFAESRGLDGQDQLESLFEAARDAGGVRFSPGDR